MSVFRYLYGIVYILENKKAKRVKVGMTINHATDRLQDVNDKWSNKKATCQICGGRRLVNIERLIPKHVVSGNSCPGGGKPPLEKDVTLAKSHLNSIKNHLVGLSGAEKGSATRIVNNLKNRIEKYQHHNEPVGVWQVHTVFYTECAEEVELMSHKILIEYLDEEALIGEVFCCSVSKATKAVEAALSQLGLLYSAKKETQL